MSFSRFQRSQFGGQFGGAAKGKLRNSGTGSSPSASNEQQSGEMPGRIIQGDSFCCGRSVLTMQIDDSDRAADLCTILWSPESSEKSSAKSSVRCSVK